jgi:uncharacterized protein YqeY
MGTPDRPPPSDAARWKATIRSMLTDAMKAGDRAATRALRTLLAAIDAAEAVQAPTSSDTDCPASSVAGAVAFGASEVPRRRLDEDDIRRIVDGEIDDRRAGADAYDASGHTARADELRHEGAIIRSVRDRMTG